MAVKFEFISAFLCERALIDQDGVLSAIRVVDIFQLPDEASQTTPIQFFACISLKTVPVPNEEITVSLTVVRVSGERERIADQSGGKPIKLQEQTPDPSVPGGVSLIVQLSIVPKNFGTCYLEVDVNGETVVRIPFTIRRIPAKPAQ